jgi:hypothetical protein
MSDLCAIGLLACRPPFIRLTSLLVLLSIHFFARRDDFLWGTVENLAPSSSQTRAMPAGGCIYISRGGVCPGEVFITFGGPQGHADRLPTCGRSSIGPQAALATPGATPAVFAACRYVEHGRKPAEVGRTPRSAAGPPASPSEARRKLPEPRGFSSPLVAGGPCRQVGRGTLWVRPLGGALWALSFAKRHISSVARAHGLRPAHPPEAA